MFIHHCYSYWKNRTQDLEKTHDPGSYEDPGPYENPGPYEESVLMKTEEPMMTSCL